MSINQRIIGHTFLAPCQLAEYVMPDNLLKGNMYLLSTIWNNHLKKGETCLFRFPKKNVYETETHPPKVIRSGYISKDDAFKTHKKLAKQIREGDIPWKL